MVEFRNIPYLTMDFETKKKFIEPLKDLEYSIFHKASLTQIFFVAAAIGCEKDIRKVSQKKDLFRVSAQLRITELAFMDSLAAKYYDYNLDELMDGKKVITALEEYANGGAEILHNMVLEKSDTLTQDIMDKFKKLSEKP